MNNNTIKVKNAIPELLEAVCQHSECPDWLKDGIWDAFANQDIRESHTASYWRGQLESMPENYPQKQDVVQFQVLRGGVQ